MSYRASIWVSGLLLMVAAHAAGQGRFRWKGTVDGIDEILIQGRSVTVEHLAAQPLRNQDYRFSASLPSRDVELVLTTIRGRGEVRLMQQPSSRNDYTAIVRIEDGRGGDDDYEFELTWDEDDDWDEWTRDEVDGLFHWEGRVDVGAEFVIQGDSFKIIDMGGRGYLELSTRFESALPAEDVQVVIDKMEGRGDVDLMQAPNASNDYTAIVRIEDDRSGPDRYKFELRWRKY